MRFFLASCTAWRKSSSQTGAAEGIPLSVSLWQIRNELRGGLFCEPSRLS